MRLQAPLRIGVDIGGTFTDVVAVDALGRVNSAKSPSHPEDPAAGVLAALGVAAAQQDCTIEALLGACSLLVHGSTIATNTLLERKGARVGLLTTAGFRDSLEIRRSIRTNVWDHRAAAPDVLVPRYLRLPVTGRLDAQGQELLALDAQTVRIGLQTFREEGVESIAICFLHSYVNPAHEHLARDIINELWPQAWVCCSADVAPVMGEYERSSTAVVNAYVGPRVVPYLRSLDAKLSALGLKKGVLLVQSNGGCVAIGELAEHSAQLILSGPAAGVSAIRFFAEDIGNLNALSIEVGGTSCDVTVAANGVVAMTDQIEVDGYHIAVPAVEIGTIGAGGGTIAHVDVGGLLHAGPEGAGSYPGPASYGRGGERPTVTDAQLVLGRLPAGPFAGDTMSLSPGKALDAIRRHVAEPLELDVIAAAAGIVRLVEQNIRHAVEKSSVERGHNPRRFTLIAAGGAGPLHGVPVARALGCKSVFVPRLAGVFCALGMCNANVRHDYQHILSRCLDDPGALDMAQDIVSRLHADAHAVLSREGFTVETMEFVHGFDLRYVGQQWSVRIDTGSMDGTVIRQVFESEHRRLYGYAQEGGRIEIVNVRVAGLGLTEVPQTPRREAHADSAEAVTSREVWIDEAHGVRSVPVYDGRELEFGHEIAGPAVVDESTTTLLVGVGDRLRVTPSGNYLIELAQPAGESSHA